MNSSLLQLALRLTEAREPFVMATVVWCERPTSSKPGAQAIIQADGTMTGWIGGSCAQPVVLREALRILREGDEPYLLRLGSSDASPQREHLRVFPMSCASGGVLDIYMEPHLPQAKLLLVGDSPVLLALSRLAEVVGFAVAQLESADLSDAQVNNQTYVIVATHGQYDEDVLEHALRSPARFVGMVASHRRAKACRAYLRSSGLSEQQIERLKSPVGLDIGAVTPEEIAASILAELVQVRRRGQVLDIPPMPSQETPASGEARAVQHAMVESEESAAAVDPVCNMLVDIATARHATTFDGRDYYFCCPACKRLFERNPQEYLVGRAEEA